MWWQEILLQVFQPRSQVPLPPFIVGSKTLAAADHITTQNLGVKKFVWQVGWQRILIVAVGNLVHFKILSSRLINYLLYQGLKLKFADEECYIIFLLSPICRKLSFRKKFGSQMEQEFSTVNTCKMSHIESKWNHKAETSESVSWIFVFGRTFIFLFVQYFGFKKHFCHITD